ncbi:hypothetical protein RJ639_039090 [Escallonia herrerae]|uniref:DUF4283 domain-containing protein n=1 Tax=Escallonia herrerae TaxID=1293975 RepID=A0AA88WLY3_9ASTE|nr:hypothetical protein RJ639_039090 [Escallonia herrerae]
MEAAEAPVGRPDSYRDGIEECSRGPTEAKEEKTRPGLSQIDGSKVSESLLEIKRLVKIETIGKLFVFHLSDLIDMGCLLLEGPLNFQGVLLVLIRWLPYQNLAHLDVSTVDIWVHVHDVLVKMFFYEAVGQIGSYFGEVQAID